MAGEAWAEAEEIAKSMGTAHWSRARLRQTGWSPGEERRAGVDRRLQDDPPYALRLAQWLADWPWPAGRPFLEALFDRETGVLSFNGQTRLDLARHTLAEQRSLHATLPAGATPAKQPRP